MLREHFGELVQPIQPQEEITQRNPVRVGRQRQIALVETLRVKLVEIDVVLERTRGLEVIDDRQRHEHGARPVAHVPEIHVKPFANEQHFARNRGHIFPREQTEQREIQLRECVHPRHAAEIHRHFARAQHPWIGDRHARELEGEIRLDGGVHLRRPAVIVVPAALRQLHREDVIDRLALPFGINFSVPVMIRDRVRDERGIHHQFADPEAVRLLRAQEILLRPLDGRFQIAEEFQLDVRDQEFGLVGLHPDGTVN